MTEERIINFTQLVKVHQDDLSPAIWDTLEIAPLKDWRPRCFDNLKDGKCFGEKRVNCYGVVQKEFEPECEKCLFKYKEVEEKITVPKCEIHKDKDMFDMMSGFMESPVWVCPVCHEKEGRRIRKLMEPTADDMNTRFT